MKLTASVFSRDFREMIEALNRAKVEYLIVGGWAVAAHGHQRVTKDLDIFVRPSLSNARRLLVALTNYGAPLAGVGEDDFARGGIVFQIGVPPWRIDIITEIDGVSFAAAARAKISVKLGRLSAPIIGRLALIRNKLASGRPRDREDADVLSSLRTAAPPRRPRSRSPKPGR